jgi:glutamate-5-semialdehyde dehydrogenase
MIDRLRLSSASLGDLAGDVRKVAELPDPVGVEFDRKVLPNGLRVHKAARADRCVGRHL